MWQERQFTNRNLIIFTRASQLLVKFFHVVKFEGVGAAVRKIIPYIRMQLSGNGLSSLPSKTYATGADHQRLLGPWRDLARGGGFHAGSSSMVLRRRRKIAMIGDMNLAQCRKYRVEQCVELWACAGVEVCCADYRDVGRCIQVLQTATHLVEYRLPSDDLTQMYRYEARRLGLPIMYDIDDPLFSISAYETYSNAARWAGSLKTHFIAQAPRYLSMMNGADTLCVSTPALRHHAALYSRRPIYLRRNFADAATLRAGAAAMAAADRDRDGFRVAFSSGSLGHEEDLKPVMQALADEPDAGAGRERLVLGRFDPAQLLPQLRARATFVPFTDYDAYLGHLATCDVAIHPLTDDVFNGCKSAVRALDASAVGVASIAPDVGDFSAVVDHGNTGFIADSPNDWHDALSELAANKLLAHRQGAQARAQLQSRWSAQLSSHIVDPGMVAWVRE
jgi:glycosyltransferase involved in cell wall biosynthesis